MTQQALKKDLNPITLSLMLPCYNVSVPYIIDVLDTTRWASVRRFIRHILCRGYVWLTQQTTETGYKFFTRELGGQ